MGEKMGLKNDFESFDAQIEVIKSFIDETRKVTEAIASMSNGHSVCTIGNNLLDSYIKLMAGFFKINVDWIEWFVFDNEFGSGDLKAGNSDDEMISIKTNKDFWDFMEDNF